MTATASAPHAASAPSLARRLLGSALTVVLTLSVALSGVDMGAEGGAWPWIAAGFGLLLVVAAWRNWPLLWNPLGKLLRTLLGERGARVAFACIALAFMLSAGLGAAA